MTSSGGTDALLLPEGSRLLHIGPHKTGTTAVQAALWAARPKLGEQGVRHAGSTRNPSAAVRAVAGRPSPYSDQASPPMRYWDALVREVRSSREPRLVISSEFFSWATPEVIRRIVDDLGSDRVRIAVTLRPLARIIPSTWQQDIQAGRVAPFETWLRALFPEPPETAGTAFWTLQRHDELIARWADVVGPERVTAVVVDERDPDMVLRVFEGLLGLRDGTLVAERDLANRSLTLPEAEAVRAFNVAFEAEDLGRALHAKVMRFGAAEQMKRRVPSAGEPRIEMPQWALDRTAETAREIVERIAASGIRVVGDLESLTRVPTGRPAADDQASVPVPPEIAASMALGVLVSTGYARHATPGTGRLQFAEPVELARVPTYQVAGVVIMRVRDSIVRRWRDCVAALARRGTPKA